MTTRRGAAKGTGSGYRNLRQFPRDSSIHAQSAKGMKQPQKLRPTLYGWKDIAPFKKGKAAGKVTLDGHTYNRKDLVALGEVYNVREDYEEVGMPVDNVPETWYEYRMQVMNKKTGRIVAEWDSLLETYDGHNKLSLKQAKNSMNEILTDVNKKGKFNYWF